MPSYLRPDDHWFIDWDDDGYMHEHSDVTGDYDSYLIRYGADTESNPSDIRLVRSQGTLRLEDSDNKYDPGSINTDIETSALRRPHACKMESWQYVPFFDMTITPTNARVNYAYHRSHDPVRGHIPSGQNTNLFTLPDTTERYDLFTMTRDNPGDPNLETLEINTGGGRAGSPQELPSYLMGLGWDWYMIVNGFYIPSSASVNPPSGREFEILFKDVPGMTYDNVWTAGVPFRWQMFVQRKRVLWSGIAVPTTGRNLTASDFADFDLESANWKEYRKERNAENSNAIAKVGGTLTSFISEKANSSLYDESLSRLNAVNIGRANYEGTEISFINECAIYACGWATENSKGKVSIHSWEAALAVEPTVTIDTAWKPQREGHLFEHRPRYVRNYAKPEALGIVTDALLTELNTFRINSSTLTTPMSQRWEDNDAGTLSIEWPTDAPALVSRIDGPTDASPVTITSQVNENLKTINVIARVTPLPSDPAFKGATFTIKVVGKRRKIQVVKTQTLQETASIADFGNKELKFPKWFANDVPSFDHANRWIDRLGTPLRYVKLVVPRWNKSQAIIDQIDNLDCGDVVYVVLRDVDNIPIRVKAIVLGVQLSRVLNTTPVKAVYAITLEEGRVVTSRWRDAGSTESGRFDWTDIGSSDPDKGYWRN